jgi:hypothetical protein
VKEVARRSRDRGLAGWYLSCARRSGSTGSRDAWSLKRFFELDVIMRSPRLAAQFEERFSRPAEVVSTPGRGMTGIRERVKTAAFAAISPFL